MADAGDVMRQITILAAAPVSGVGALAAQYLLHPTPLPPSGEYFLTGLAVAQIGPVSVVLALATAFLLGFYSRVPARPPQPPQVGVALSVLIGLLMVVVFPIIAMYEATRYRGSHNLIPFEMVMHAAGAVPLILAAWVGRGWPRTTFGSGTVEAPQVALDSQDRQGDGPQPP